MSIKQTPSNNGLKEKIRELSDEELNRVAGGAPTSCHPDSVKRDNKCWPCEEFGKRYGYDDPLYLRVCVG